MSTCEDPVSVGETFTRTVPTRHYPLSTFSWELVRYRTEFFGTTNQRFTVKASNSIFKPINVGLRCTLFNPLSHPSPLLKQELSVSDTTFKVFVLLEGIEPSFHSYQECVLTILLQEQFYPTSPA